MSGGLFISALLRETGRTLSEADIEAVQQAHGADYLAQIDSVRPLPGPAELLAALAGRRPSRKPGAGPSLWWRRPCRRARRRREA